MMKTAAEIFEAVLALPRPPVAVQAWWDGDSEGWMVCIDAVHAYGQSFGSESIACLRGSDGDLRLFNGGVPPWPEAQIASEAGRLIESRLKIPFFFPSPEEPEEDCPRWWDRHLAKPCLACGKLLLQEPKIPWLGYCYKCHLKNERSAAKEA